MGKRFASSVQILQTHDEAAPVQLRMRHANLSKDLRYNALSYAWGPEDQKFEINRSLTKMGRKASSRCEKTCESSSNRLVVPAHIRRVVNPGSTSGYGSTKSASTRPMVVSDATRSIRWSTYNLQLRTQLCGLDSCLLCQLWIKNFWTRKSSTNGETFDSIGRIYSPA